jgi:hypothetical protein
MGGHRPKIVLTRGHLIALDGSAQNMQAQRSVEMCKMMNAGRTWCFLRGSSERLSFSIRGIRNARVFPDPVQASTETSLLPQNNGMAASWTGVARSKPKDSKTASVSGEICGISLNLLVCSIMLCL